jgi:Holliday junction resolvase RusA-like endonuclease
MMLDSPITFEVPGHPQGKGRARSSNAGGFVRHYTPEKTRSYEGIIRTMAYAEMAGREPTDQPVELLVTAIFDVPKSFSKAKRAMALGNAIKPAKKPDLDNIAKAITDAMNGVVFKDDAQIVICTLAKIYGEVPRVVATIKPNERI